MKGLKIEELTLNYLIYRLNERLKLEEALENYETCTRVLKFRQFVEDVSQRGLVGLSQEQIRELSSQIHEHHFTN